MRKPSPHAAKAYHQVLEAIATMVAGTSDGVLNLWTDELKRDNLRATFVVYAEMDSPASIRALLVDVEPPLHVPVPRRAPRCQSMSLIGRPKVPKSIPKR